MDKIECASNNCNTVICSSGTFCSDCKAVASSVEHDSKRQCIGDATLSGFDPERIVGDGLCLYRSVLVAMNLPHENVNVTGLTEQLTKYINENAGEIILGNSMRDILQLHRLDDPHTYRRPLPQFDDILVGDVIIIYIATFQASGQAQAHFK